MAEFWGGMTLGASKKAPTRAPNFSSLPKVRFLNSGIFDSSNGHISYHIGNEKQSKLQPDWFGKLARGY